MDTEAILHVPDVSSWQVLVGDGIQDLLMLQSLGVPLARDGLLGRGSMLLGPCWFLLAAVGICRILLFSLGCRLGLLEPLRLEGDNLVLLHQGGAHGGLSRLALRGGREGHVLLEVVLDLLLELDEALAVLALLVR